MIWVLSIFLWFNAMQFTCYSSNTLCHMFKWYLNYSYILFIYYSSNSKALLSILQKYIKRLPTLKDDFKRSTMIIKACHWMLMIMIWDRNSSNLFPADTGASIFIVLTSKCYISFWFMVYINERYSDTMHKMAQLWLVAFWW